ncbi:hypothetical protein TSUD_285050 [Trifolium subterraneum]|uniref:Uncharacterized protein n=1 Tax=Trifolium subterraneum TaxID=3900 RepID=A0A2Z6NY19_TRISU|nr:hypothetical protein TSUD_285050 [Trifolium subterraneum]
MIVFACVDFSTVTVCDTVIDLDGNTDPHHLLQSSLQHSPVQIYNYTLAMLRNDVWTNTMGLCLVTERNSGWTDTMGVAAVKSIGTLMVVAVWVVELLPSSCWIWCQQS